MTMYQNIVLADRRPAFSTSPESTSYATAAEMLEAAGLAGWQVEPRSLFAELAEGEYVEVPNRWANVRTDTGQPLGVVGGGYSIIQNEEAFAFGDMLLDQPGRHWERAGLFKHGEVVFGALELGDLKIKVPKDDGGITPYLLIVNSHGGSTAYEAIITWVRPRCVNTFTFARRHFHSKWRLRHTGDLSGKVAQAREALGIAFQHTKEVAELAGAMAKHSILDTQIRDIFEQTVWPITDEQRTKGVPNTHPANQAMVLYQQSPTLDGIRGTAWGGFQAVTEYVDHFTEFRTRVDRHTPEQQRSYVLMLGSGDEVKTKALNAFAATVR